MKVWHLRKRKFGQHNLGSHCNCHKLGGISTNRALIITNIVHGSTWSLFMPSNIGLRKLNQVGFNSSGKRIAGENPSFISEKCPTEAQKFTLGSAFALGDTKRTT